MARRDNGGIPGEFPKFGAIFMSSKATRKECFERELLGLPSGQWRFVRCVKAGMLLFLFEFERRELHGVFQATCDGAMNIVPDAYSSSGKQFPAQVKFTKIWCCASLVEKEFRDAIRENYFSSFKFNFGLSEKQVTRLLKLFSSKKLKIELHPRKQVHGEAARRLEYPVQKDVDALSHRRIVLSNEEGERNENGTFKPVKANVWLGKSFGNEIDNEEFLLEGKDDEQNEHRSFEWKSPGEEFECLGYPERDNSHDQLLGATMGKVHELRDFREVGRLTDYERPVIREHSQDIDTQPVESNYLIHSVSADRRRSHDAAFSETYRLTEENDHGGCIVSSIPSNCQDFQLSPDIYFPKPFVGVNSLANSEERSYYGDVMGRGSFIHSPGARTLADSADHYDTDLLRLDCDRSKSLCDIDFPRLNYKYITSPPRNSSGTECSSPSHWSIPSSGNMSSPRYYADTSYNESPYAAGRTANSAMLKRKAHEDEDSLCFSFPKPSFASAASAEPEHYGRALIKERFSPAFGPCKSSHLSFDSRCAVFSHEKLGHRLLPFEGSEAYVGHIPVINDCQTRTTISHRERMPSDTELHPPKTFHSDRQNKRASVFSRLTLPAEATKVVDSDDRTGNESSFDLSLSDILAMLHQSSDAWTKDKCLKPVPKVGLLVSKSSSKKKMTSKMNVSRDQVTGISAINSSPSNLEGDARRVSKSSTERKMTTRTEVAKDQVTDASDIISSTSCQATEVQTTREIPFLDFKRRNKVKRSEDNPTDNNQNILSGGQQKRRRLIRPIFSNNVVSDDMFGNNETGSKESQLDKIPEHVGQEEKHVDVAGYLKSEVDGIVETRHDKIVQPADQEDMHVDVENCSKSEEDAIMETQHDKMVQPADKEDMHVNVANCSKSEADAIMETQHDKMTQTVGQEEKHVDVASCPESEADAIMETQHDKVPEHADQEDMHVDVAGCSKSVADAIMETWHEKMPERANQEDVHVDVAGCSKSVADAIMETRHNKLPEHADREDMNVDAASCLKFGAGQTMEIVALPSGEGCYCNKVLLTDVCIRTVPSMVPSSVSKMAESDESKPLQNANKKSSRFQIDVEDKDVDGEMGFVNAAKMDAEASVFSGVASNIENQVEASLNANVQDAPSQQSVKDKTLNVEEVLLFKNSKGGLLLQDQPDQFLQELVLEDHRGQVKEQMETGFPSIVTNKVDNENEESKNKPKASQLVDIEDMPSQLSDKEETLDAEKGLLFKNPTSGYGNYYQHVDAQGMPSQLCDEVETLNTKEGLLFKNPPDARLLQDEHGNHYEHVDIEGVPSQLSDKEETLDAKEGLLFKNPTGDHLLQDGHGNYYQFLQEPVLEMRREQTETWNLSGVTDHVNKAFQNDGTFPISGETGSISCLVDRSTVCDGLGKGKEEDGLGKGKEEDELLLSLGSLTRQYNIWNRQEYLPKEL